MPCAEFNFGVDPESAYIVLEEYLCPTHIATWEFTCRNKLSYVRIKKQSTTYNLSSFLCLHLKSLNSGHHRNHTVLYYIRLFIYYSVETMQYVHSASPFELVVTIETVTS